MKILKYTFLLLFLASCNTPRVVHDYDEKVAFTEITTYEIYPDLVTNLNQLDEQRLLGILAEELSKKGMTASSEKPQIYVNFYASEFEMASGSNIGLGMGGTGRNMGVGVSGGVPVGGPNTYLSLTLDFIDAEKDSLIWQAEIQGKFNKDTTPQNREARLRTFITRALKDYPPSR